MEGFLKLKMLEKLDRLPQAGTSWRTGRRKYLESRLAKVNRTKTSQRLRKLYRIRKRRFRHAVNAMVKAIVEDASQLDISKIILGDLRSIRMNSHNNSRANPIIHNFWNFRYIIQRFKK